MAALARRRGRRGGPAARRVHDDAGAAGFAAGAGFFAAAGFLAAAGFSFAAGFTAGGGLVGDFAGRGVEWVGNYIALGGAWMIYKNVIRWHIPVAVIAGVLIPATVVYLVDPGSNGSPGRACTNRDRREVHHPHHHGR